MWYRGTFIFHIQPRGHAIFFTGNDRTPRNRGCYNSAAAKVARYRAESIYSR